MRIIEVIKKRVFKERANADSYISYLRNKGMRIGERVVILRPRSLTIDETRPWLIEIGNDVQIHDYYHNIHRTERIVGLKYDCIREYNTEITIGAKSGKMSFAIISD